MRKSITVKPLGGKKIKHLSRLGILTIFLMIFTIPCVFSGSDFSEGEKLFMLNKPQEAIPLLEKALNTTPSEWKIYNYLGIAYEQTKNYEKAIEIYKKGLDKSGDMKGAFLTNIGNNYSLLGSYDSALEYYSKALALGYNGAALRNRAGEYLRKGSYSEALADYKKYLSMEDSPYQGEEIQRIITLIEGKLDQIAKQQIEEERKRLEEEARQKALLSNVLDSLNSAGNETTNLSAGTEDADNYSEDFDIVD